MSLRYLRTVRLLNSRFLVSNYKITQNVLNNVNKFSTTISDTTGDKKKLEKEEGEQAKKTEEKDERLASNEDEKLASNEDEKDDEEKKEEEKKKKRKRYAVRQYPNNPPGLMEFFDDPINWGEEDVKSGRSWKVEELRNKSNSDLHKLWYVLLKERNMLLTMQAAHEKEAECLPSEERIYKVNDSMKNLEQVVRERNKAYWQLEVDQNETGERPVAFRKDIYGRFRWITCSEHFVPMAMNKKWKIFSGPGTGRHVYEFIRRYKEKQATKQASRLHQQAFEVRQLLRRFPKMDMEALQAKYPEIDIEKQKENLDSRIDNRYRRIIPRYFRMY